MKINMNMNELDVVGLGDVSRERSVHMYVCRYECDPDVEESYEMSYMLL